MKMHRVLRIKALEELVKAFREVHDLADRLARVYPPHILKEMIYMPAVSTESLSDRTVMEAWLAELKTRVESEKVGGSSTECSLEEDPELNVWLPKVTITSHGIPESYRFTYDFFASVNYGKIAALGKQLQGLIEEGAFIQKGERKKEVSSFEDALEWLMKESTKRHYIQRYKGLGEMNPDQLWETTMDPDVRRMLKVTIDDAIAADQIFNTLMGDHVEPRRAFIESNALHVANLDI